MRLRATLAVLIALCLFSCNGGDPIETSLGDVLRQNHYVPYKPFRSMDYPGTIFVLGAGEYGDTDELTISRYDETFDQDKNIDLDAMLKAQDVEFLDEFTRTSSIGGSLSLELASLAISPELGAAYAKSISVKLSDPKRKVVLSLATLAKHADDFDSGTLKMLDSFKRSNQLSKVFIVHDVLQAGVEITVTLKDEYKGELGLERLKQIAKLEMSFERKSESVYSISTEKPMLIGYKPIRFPPDLIREDVSAISLDDIPLKDRDALADAFNEVLDR